MDSRELSEWMVYYSLEPWGAAQDEYHFALLASILANSGRDPEKKRAPFEVMDFVRPGFQLDLKGEEEESVDLFTKAKAIFGILGAKTDGNPG